MQDLLDVCCLWEHIKDDIASYFGPGEELDKIESMWNLGHLGCNKTTTFQECQPKPMYFPALTEQLLEYSGF